jgi:hypothetical protein
MRPTGIFRLRPAGWLAAACPLSFVFLCALMMGGFDEESVHNHIPFRVVLLLVSACQY